MREYKGRGVVLNTTRYGESSLIVHLLTDVAGRESYIVRGIRGGKGGKGGKGSKAKAAIFQPLFTLEFEGVRPMRGELHSFREVRSGIILQRTPFDIRRSTIALFIAEVLYRLIREQEANESLFDFVWHSIEALDSAQDGAEVANFHIWFLANLSRELGFLPAGEWCKGDKLDIAEGRFTIFPRYPSQAIESDIAEIFYAMTIAQPGHIGAVEMGREQRVRVLNAMINYFDHHLEGVKNIESIEVLREIY